MNNDIWNRFGDEFNVLLFSCPLCICKLLSLTLWWEYGGHAKKISKTILQNLVVVGLLTT